MSNTNSPHLMHDQLRAAIKPNGVLLLSPVPDGRIVDVVVDMGGSSSLMTLSEFSDLTRFGQPSLIERMIEFGLIALPPLSVDRLTISIAPELENAILEMNGSASARVGWQLLGGLLILNEVVIQFVILNPASAAMRYLDFSIGAKTTLFGISAQVDVAYPDFALTASFASSGSEGSAPVPVGKVFEYFFPGLGDDSLLGKLQASDVIVTINPRTRSFSAWGNLSSPASLPGPGPAIKLESLLLQMERSPQGGEFSVSALWQCGSVPLSLSGHYSLGGGGWQLDGWSFFEIPLAIGDLLASALEKYFKGLPIPSSLRNLGVSSFTASIDTGRKDLAFTCAGDFNSISPTSSEGTSSFEVDVELLHSPDGGYASHFAGRLLLVTGQADAAREFDLIFAKDKAASVFFAEYKNPGGDSVDLGEILKGLTGAPDLPSLNFKLKDALLAYGGGCHLLLADMDVGLDLSGLGGLPLIGKALPQDQKLSLSFQALHSSAPPAGETWQRVLGLLPDGAPPLPADYVKGFRLATTLKIGDQLWPAPLNLGDNKNDDKLGTPQAPTSTPATPPDPRGALAAASTASVSWIDLQKHFGPLFVERIGIGSRDRKIDVLIDAGIAVGPLSLALEGLGAEYDLEHKTLTFTLTGAALDFDRAPLAINGSFLRMADNFAGEAMLKMEELSITALGAFSEVDGHPSLFLYAAVNYPLGGPAFFFVTGFAAGFGVNRCLLVPPIQEIHNFPLVTAAIGGQALPAIDGGKEMASAVQNQLMLLEKYVPPQLGEYFFAVGIRFTSFKLIDCFALLALSVGREFEIDVLGVATATEPPDAPPGTPVIARAQLEFLVKFAPAEGLLAAQAQLTPQSYLYNPFCHLQGGFAFYSWFSGEHAGDFVTTLGGYHPNFTVPKHYPAVPRLGFNWQVTPQVLIKGEAYFAMTPNAVMAGGSLQATYNDDDVQAWFIVGADFLMYWKPFHYIASAEIEIGAALTVHCFGTHHITISAGAELQLWGPPFAGTARVHVKVLVVHVSFTVSFGDGSPAPPPKIDWDDFKKSFLPPVDKVCSVSIQAGLIRALKDSSDGQRWIVNRKELCLVTDSLFPSTLAGQIDNTTADDKWEAPKPNKKLDDNSASHGSVPAFGIDPMGVEAQNLDSEQVVRVLRERTDVSNDFYFIPIFKQVPCALWNPNASLTSSPGINQPQMVTALTGYQLHPAKPPVPGKTCFIKDEHLQYEVTPHDMSPAGAAVHAGYGNVVKQTDNRSKLADSFTSTTAVSKRRKLLDQLGFDSASVALHASLLDAFVIAPQVAEASLV